MVQKQGKHFSSLVSRECVVGEPEVWVECLSVKTPTPLQHGTKQRKHLSWFRENVWLESLKESTVASQQGTWGNSTLHSTTNIIPDSFGMLSIVRYLISNLLVICFVSEFSKTDQLTIFLNSINLSISCFIFQALIQLSRCSQKTSTPKSMTKLMHWHF